MTSIESDLSAMLDRQAQRAWHNILERLDARSIAELSTLIAAPKLQRQLARALACSPFIARTLRNRPTLLLELLCSGILQRPLGEEELREQLQLQLAVPEADLTSVLRCYRQLHMVRIIWRDFCRLADTLETMRDTSLLADVTIYQAQEVSRLALEDRYGRPMGAASGKHQQLIVLAMGKLGARELNVSSDVDLIFAFDESGYTDSENASISNQEFFTKLGQALINALDQVTVDGFVFRVDMRLRPYGESGALVSNFAALEQYYQDQGRDWERYAMIKARPITGIDEHATVLMETLRPFVYRRYIDFGVIESLRDMKQMINGEVRRRNLQDDVKLGHGGIREVEFIAQCFQLIRGGRERSLQRRELLPILAECAKLGCLPEQVVDELSAAYLFLRDSEHAIQGYGDLQTQALPVDELARTAMATVMGCANWQEYLLQLERYRANVDRHFQALIAAPTEQSSVASTGSGEPITIALLEQLGFGQPAAALQLLDELQQTPRVVTLQAEGKSRLHRFLPQLLEACADTHDADLALQRVMPLVVSVLRRSAYFVMLMENPVALNELAALCGASPWMARQLSQHPVLLDELLDRESLYTAPDKNLLRDELRQQTARLTAGDLEAQMEVLRYFKASHVLRVAASELVGRLPLMQVSDKLTWIADVILEHVVTVAWLDLCAKYGEPARTSEGPGFAIYGYGKLGGIELGYGSDLDLVFVCETVKGGQTDGQRSIDNSVFYTRLGQRIIHILDTRMALGQLYEVDMRLRPSGDSGMLVIGTTGFRDYQKDSAWTWEHQALVRARFVAGDQAVASQIDDIRTEILSMPRDQAKLAQEVGSMRAKMRDHLLPQRHEENREFHLKQDSGGIVDIEFMVQYAVLAWSHKVPELTRWSDNVRILEVLGREGLFEQHECDALAQAYLAYRAAAHQLALQQQADSVPVERFAESKIAVETKWRQLFGDQQINKAEE
jgi:glutamate-ammonia-ligase adenylyltransferase